AGMDVQGFSQIFHGHRGTFDVPSGAPATYGCVPEMFAGFWGFPESKIASAFFFIPVDINASTGLYSSDVNFGKLSVVGEFGNAIVDGTLAGVCVGLFLEALDELDHGIDVVGGANPVLGRLDAEGLTIIEEGLDEFLSVVANADTGGGSVSDDAIVDVGEIHYMIQAETTQLQETAENILKNEGAVLADVGVVVNGGAAGVHANFAGILRDERLGLAGQGIVEANFGH